MEPQFYRHFNHPCLAGILFFEMFGNVGHRICEYVTMFTVDFSLGTTGTKWAPKHRRSVGIWPMCAVRAACLVFAADWTGLGIWRFLGQGRPRPFSGFEPSKISKKAIDSYRFYRWEFRLYYDYILTFHWLMFTIIVQVGKYVDVCGNHHDDIG